ncbi:MAG: prephenate dehydrogenase [Flavobacteriaceae bacterium]|nr:prephenate dehydrogenase [Flavobacteriaceae bacterium]
MESLKLGLVGVGLMNGSLALDVKNLYNDVEVYGMSRRQTTLDKALELGLIDYRADMHMLADMDVVAVAIPVEATAGLLPQILDHIGSDTLVFDMGSTKVAICEAVAQHPKRNQFLACHPIAGTEFSGPEAALPRLYEGKVNMLCEVEKTRPDLVSKAQQLFSDLGMVLRQMNPVDHDRHIAYVSHLSHITSFMLGKTVMEKEADEQSIFDMAGSGFSSTVRLAKSSPEMWVPIFKQNKENVLETLEEYIMNLNHFRDLMQSDDYEAITLQMKEINNIKHILKPDKH